MINIIQSNSVNIYENLILEEILLNYSNDKYILLYINSTSVVIGKNQNPWLEFNTLLMNDKIKYARRISGGGTVVHDEGNINISFIGFTQNDIIKNINIIIESCKTYSINLYFKNKLDILNSDDLKVSGSAFIKKRNRFMHHMTLLVSSNIKNIKNILQHDTKYNKINIISNTIKSRKANIINLYLMNSNINTNTMLEEIIARINYQYKVKFIKLNNNRDISNTLNIDTNIFDNLLKLRTSFEWLWGYTSSFYIQLDNLYKTKLYIEKGLIVKAEHLNIKIIDKEYIQKINNLMFSILSIKNLNKLLN